LNLDEESTWNSSHSRSKSTDAKELARIKKSSDVTASSSPKPPTKRTSIFGKKKSVDSPAVEEAPSSGPSLHLPPTLPPMPEGMTMPSAGRLSLRPAPAFLAALDSSMMRRSSYVQLVDKGIVREWNDSPALDSDMIAALPPPSALILSSHRHGFAATSTFECVPITLAAACPSSSGLPNTNKSAQGRLHSSGVFPVPMPSFWNGSPRVSNVMVQPSGPDGGWHVERGSAVTLTPSLVRSMPSFRACRNVDLLASASSCAQDFVEGAYNALEDDHSSPYFKIYFNGKGSAHTCAPRREPCDKKRPIRS
jgi:hypothetical protein